MKWGWFALFIAGNNFCNNFWHYKVEKKKAKLQKFKHGLSEGTMVLPLGEHCYFLDGTDCSNVFLMQSQHFIKVHQQLESHRYNYGFQAFNKYPRQYFSTIDVHNSLVVLVTCPEKSYLSESFRVIFFSYNSSQIKRKQHVRKLKSRGQRVPLTTET